MILDAFAKTAFAACKNSLCKIQSTAVSFRRFGHSPIINRRENAQTDKNKQKYVLCRLASQVGVNRQSAPT